MIGYESMDEIKDIWKQFGQVRPGHRAIHHLMAINYLASENGFATTSGIANFLNVSHGSVVGAIRKLIESGTILEDKRNHYRLSSDGVDIVNTVLEKRRVVEIFLIDILGLNRLEALADACKVEHLFSQTTTDKLILLVGLLKGNSESAKSFLKEFNKAKEYCKPGQVCNGCKIKCSYAMNDPDLIRDTI